ncbi:rsmD, RAS family GTPase [Dictyostelium purpureum]|uniref:RsmD, RAS family GTPase n=1 Tax=Dictyostelium purpureum TaxID=5786 RepID=F1A497_DICPU|nr:rsmD, RAS family GTPase [Dictyostelium purpureum]EGC28982.1 rsmD, RAS family GTPase [Dictyostelium purpureum]|eukprot:XP_003294491.1 rsmD, RAS family GTPase [Dictyostelium purpureum]
MCKSINICLLGSSLSGKTCLINSFIYSSFSDDQYYPTIENKLSKIYSFNKVLYNINIYDTAGSSELDNLVPDTIKVCDAFIIVYSLNNRESIDKIDYYRDLILKYKSTGQYLSSTSIFQQSQSINIPIMLVANKSDLSGHVISKTESQDLAQYYKMPLVISSCKNLNSVHNVFNTILKEIQNQSDNIKKQEIINNNNYLNSLNNTNNGGGGVKKIFKTKSQFFFNTNQNQNRTKSEYCLKKKKKDIITYFKDALKDFI